MSKGSRGDLNCGVVNVRSVNAGGESVVGCPRWESERERRSCHSSCARASRTVGCHVRKDRVVGLFGGGRVSQIGARRSGPSPGAALPWNHNQHFRRKVRRTTGALCAIVHDSACCGDPEITSGTSTGLSVITVISGGRSMCLEQNTCSSRSASSH